MAIEVLSAVGRWDHFAALLARSGCVCMVYRNSSRAGFRRRGLMHDLLDGAIEHARASGAVVIEGYPVDPEGEPGASPGS